LEPEKFGKIYLVGLRIAMQAPSNIPSSAILPMITYVVGDIFHSPAKVLVNTVNTKGVMGKGLAKDFKAIYPEMFQSYQRLCDEKHFDVGQLYVFRTPNKWVLNFPTKRDWKHPSRPEYIEAGLKAFVSGYAKANITSVAFPQLGCGHGELDWATQVQPLMENYLSTVPIPIFIHLYRKNVFPKEHQDLAGTKRWLNSEPESLSFQEVWDDLIAIVTQHTSFSVLNGSGQVRVTDVLAPEEGLRFEGTDTFVITKDRLLDLWQHFRSFGLLVPDNLPEGLHVHANEILSLFVNLPYVQKVQVAKGRAPLEQHFITALQLVPRSTSDEPLFRMVPEATAVATHA
jgi:O-acetyl-ADP-ribose deacetylase (regulator of RNase III)